MRIELCAGGIGGIAVSDFQADMQAFLSEKESVLASFKVVSNNTGDLSGGVGSLQGAMEDIQARIIQEETALENARNIQTSMNDFLSLAQRVDAQVASDVNQNKADFYGKYPELRSTSSDEEKAWYEKAWEALCGVGEAIKESVEDGLEVIADTLKNAWDGLVEFYENNKERIWQILIGVAAIAIAVIVTVATGGAALPALAALAKAAITAGLMSAAIGGSITAVMALANGESLEDTLDATLNSAIDGFCSGFMWGGIMASASQIAYSIKTILPQTSLPRNEQVIVNHKNGKVVQDRNHANLLKRHSNAQQEITIQTPGGVRTRVDSIARTKYGKIIIQESKASATAPLTKNQIKAFPEILKSGGIVKGTGKGIFTNGFVIPPGTKVQIIRPVGVKGWEWIAGGFAGSFWSQWGN